MVLLNLIFFSFEDLIINTFPIVFSWPGKLAKDHKLLQISFGSSKDFVTAVADAFKGEKTEFAKSLENSLEAANQVAACGYESGTDWGKKVSAK